MLIRQCRYARWFYAALPFVPGRDALGLQGYWSPFDQEFYWKRQFHRGAPLSDGTRLRRSIGPQRSRSVCAVQVRPLSHNSFITAGRSAHFPAPAPRTRIRAPSGAAPPRRTSSAPHVQKQIRAARQRALGAEAALAPRSRQSAPWAACRGLIPGLLMCWVPWSQGKMQGISPIQPLCARICLENIWETSSFETNSLRGRAGNYFARAGNFSTGAGNLARNRSKWRSSS